MYIGGLNLIEFWNGLSMTFVSGFFVVLVVLLFAFYYATRLERRWVVLLCGSIIFTLIGGIQVFIIPALLSVIGYVAALVIESTEKEEKRKRKTILTTAIIVFVTTLSLVKLNVFLEWGTTAFIFPIGISYYSFSLISYVADVYWRKDKAETNYFKLLLFTLYFPKILQGPIARHKLLAPQLNQGHHFCYTEVCYGLQIMLWGYFKKLVIAERLNIMTGTVINNYERYGGALILLMYFASAIQLYCDFSGCMDMASGLSQMFGIKLEKNFERPFFSKSAAEFWRRWHMTLGTWFKDYVYMPLVISPKVSKIARTVKTKYGNNAGKMMMTVIPLSAVWLLTGIWHGSGINYVLWGVYWGTLIIFSTIFSNQIKVLNERMKINTETWSWKMFQMIRTYMLFAIGRIISATPNPQVLIETVQRIFKSFAPWELVNGTINTLGLDSKNVSIVWISIVILWMMECIQEKCQIRKEIASWNLVFRALFYSCAFLIVLVFGVWGPNYSSISFAYMNF